MALLLNRYPSDFIEKQFSRVLQKFKVDQPLTEHNYKTIRNDIINTPAHEKLRIDYGRTMFIHFTYCQSMQALPGKFHQLWDKYFAESPIDEIQPILGTRNVDNLQRQLVKNKTVTPHADRQRQHSDPVNTEEE